jgi:hypothetical protein
MYLNTGTNVVGFSIDGDSHLQLTFASFGRAPSVIPYYCIRYLHLLSDFDSVSQPILIAGKHVVKHSVQ